MDLADTETQANCLLKYIFTDMQNTIIPPEVSESSK